MSWFRSKYPRATCGPPQSPDNNYIWEQLNDIRKCIDAKQDRYVGLPNGTLVPVELILLAVSELQNLQIVVSNKKD